MPISAPPDRTTRTTRPTPADRHGLPAALRAGTALVATAGFLGAVPWLLWQWRANPLPHSFEPGRWVQLAVDGYIHPDVIPNLLAVAIWLVWAQLALAVTRELASQLVRGTAARRSPLVLPPVQTFAAHLIATITVVFSSPAATAAPPLAAIAHAVSAETTPHAAPRSTSATGWTPSQPGGAPGTSSTRAARTAVVEAGGSGPARPAQAGQVGQMGQRHVCRPFDTLRSVAAAYYGDPDQWAAIRDASVGVRQADGTTLQPGFISVTEGTELCIPPISSPAEVPLAAADDAAPAGGTAHRTAAVSRADHVLSATRQEHRVVDGDTLWDIADQRYPGATTADLPRIVTAIFAANLGVDDRHGHTLHDPDVLHPGMRLRLPPVGPERDTGARGQTGAPQSTDPAGAHRSSAEHDLPDEASGLLGDVVPSTATAPHRSPAASHQDQPTPPDTPEPGAGSQAGHEPTADTVDETGDETDEAADESVVESVARGWVETAVLLVAGFLAVASYRRRRRDARIRPGQTPPAPDPDLIPLHTAMRAAHDPDTPQRIDAALRSVAALHRRTPSGMDGRVGSASPGGPVLEVLLAQPDGAIDVLVRGPGQGLPEPWRPTTDQRIWHLPPDAQLVLDEASAEMPYPNPLLVQLGTTPDGAALFVDLEVVGVLALGHEFTDRTRGAPDTMRGIARALTAALATSPLAHLPRVRTSGFDPFGFVGEERIHAHAMIGEVLHHLGDDAATMANTLDRHQVPSTLALRARSPYEAVDPTIAIVVDHDITRGQGERLAGFAGDGGRGVAVVLPAAVAPAGAWRLTHTAAGADGALGEPRVGEGLWRLDPLGITLRPVSLAGQELADLAALLHDASAPAATPGVVLPFRKRHDDPAEPHAPIDASDIGDSDPETRPRQPAAFTAPTWSVMVRLLGNVDLTAFDGTTAGGVRDRTLEAIAWLVLHRGGSRTRMEAALWPTGAHAGTVSNTLSRARAVLEQLAGPPAHEWIPTYQAGLTIDAAVTTDLDVLQAHLDYALRHRAHPEAAIPVLRAGLTLVRGTPAAWPWLDAELGSTLTTTPTTAAVLLAGLCLEAGDLDGVYAAAHIGLSIIPAHPEMFSLRMRARAAAGDRAGVRAEYEAYLRAENDDPMTDGDTDRDLERLFTNLYRATGRH